MLLGSAGCSRSPQESSQQAPPRAVTRVAVTPARRMPLVSDLSLTAEFRPHQEVDVMAKVSGYLNSIQVDVGDRVREGQLLAVIEVPEMGDELLKNGAAITRSQAELQRAKQEVERALMAREFTEISHSRLAAVVEKRPGLVAQQEIDTVRNRDLLAQSQIATARSTLAATEQSVHILEAETGRLKTLQNYTRVTAPFDGVVTKRFADTGAMIQAGTSSQSRPIARIAETRVLRLILPVPESAVPRLRAGSMVEVRVESLGQTFSGRIARFSNQIQTATRTMETEVDVPNPRSILMPGMFAQAVIRIDERLNALSVPVDAVNHEHGKSMVLVVNREGILESRTVLLGIETPQQVEVTKGLEEGDLVVLGNRSQLRVGQKVESKRVDEQPDAASKGKG